MIYLHEKLTILIIKYIISKRAQNNKFITKNVSVEK